VLSASSSEIGEVVSLISSIAAQTNLLALNATIEAARAGDAGRGFAVVAEEVKQLAGETTKAASTITGRVESMQANTNDVVRAMSEMITAIAEINDAQRTIAAAFEEQSATANSMGASASGAALSSNEISANIAGVAVAAEQASETATRTHDAAVRLAAHAAELQALVGQFRTAELVGAAS
jgi:methyl-accepting chemotaxis protein